MTIKQYTAAGLTGAATIIMFAATPAMACSHPTVHQTKVVEHKQTDEHKKDCDHKKVEVKKVETHKDCDHKDVKKVVEHKEIHKEVKKDCDHKVVEQKKVVEHKDCDHKKVTKPGKGGGTPTPTPVPTPQVLSASTQPSSLPQTGANDLALLIGLPTVAGAGAAYLRYKLRK